jgi:hypothetical protein
MTRSNNAPLDKELRQKQIFGNRQPVETRTNSEAKGAASGTVEPNETRKTGAVNRPTVKQNNDMSEPQTRPEPQQTFPTRSNDRKSSGKEDQPPIYSPPTRQEEPARRETRQPKREEPRYEPPARQEQPRYEPPKRDEPKSEPPPRREEPKNDPPKRSDPPPQKSEPKSDPKPDKPAEVRSSKKDN